MMAAGRMYNYVIDYIPKSTPYVRRPGTSFEPSTITVHNTGNPSSTARNERGWLTNPSNKRRASFHIGIDEREVIECIPLNEPALHAGTSAGNRTSIGVEICESGDYERAVENAVLHVAKMLRERGWGTDRLRRHYDWSGKICPRLMYSGGTWAEWETFKKRVAAELSTEVEALSISDKVTVSVEGHEIEAGVIINGITYVPVRAVAEALGYRTVWNGKSKTVTITK